MEECITVGKKYNQLYMDHNFLNEIKNVSNIILKNQESFNINRNIKITNIANELIYSAITKLSSGRNFNILLSYHDDEISQDDIVHKINMELENKQSKAKKGDYVLMCFKTDLDNYEFKIYQK